MACSSSSNFAKIRNVIILGKIGSGKSTIINKVLGVECVEARFSFSRVTTEIRKVSRPIEVEGEKYHVNFIDTLGIFDSKSEVKKDNEKTMTDIKEAIKTHFSGGVNLIIVTANIAMLDALDIEIFKMLEDHFKAMFWKVCILVFTHRDKINRVTVKKKICDFKENAKSKFIASKFDERIYTVGFPPAEDIRDDHKDMLLKEIPIDIDNLRKVIANAKNMEPPEAIVSHTSKCVVS